MHLHQENCIFCKIINDEINTTKIYEDEEFIAFNDIKPSMPVHILLIPKLHIPMLSTMKNNQQDSLLLGKMLLLAPVLAKKQGCINGFKININNDKGGGQEVFHLHIHIMGNKD